MAANSRVCLLALLLAGCGEDASEGGAAPPSYSPGAGATAGSGAGIPPMGSGGAAPLPPEVELESSYRAPIVTGHYVWSANPESGRIAVIDPESLVVRLAEAGFQPSELA